MKAFLFYSILVTAAFLLSSCEKVIKYNLSESSPTLVIEAQLSNVDDFSMVKLSKSKSFDDDNTLATVSNAFVTITSEFGMVDTLTETSAGLYKPHKLKAKPGRSYLLTVIVENKTYTATSTVPSFVKLDSLGFTSESFGMSKAGEDIYSAIPYYSDPLEVENYYRFVEKINGVTEKTLFVRNDTRTNGKIVTQILRNFGGTEIKKGNSVEISMIQLDSNVYDYFYGLSQISSDGGSSSGTPTNPKSNINGGALGYFSAQTVQSLSTVVQ